MTRLPSLFVSLGSQDSAASITEHAARLAALARSLPRPRAIVVASAHWLTRSPMVGGATRPVTIHDPGGAAHPLFDLRYPASGDPHLAQRIVSRLELAGLAATIHPTRGLDHGIWAPLHLLYPQAEIPVTPLAIQPHLGPHHQFLLGRALAPLREDGVLLIGSGSLRQPSTQPSGQRGDADTRAFVKWLEGRMARDDLHALFDYRRQALLAGHAAPSDEHLQPLYFALGAGGGDLLGAERLDIGAAREALAMDVYCFEGEHREPAIAQAVAAP
ncbi:MAG: class III extradiol ring-cleavage dioxygenase [Lysobacteraceae bacterium]|jgi:4,5-DOPA dioxygenase extradiol